jgi:hypothetical protein
MPFSSLRDPAELARAGRILDAAWAALEQRGVPTFGTERVELAYIVVALLQSPGSDEEIAEAAVARFIERSACPPGSMTQAESERVWSEPAAPNDSGAIQ